MNSIIDVIDQAVESVSELAYSDGESLAEILLNYDEDDLDDCEEVLV